MASGAENVMMSANADVIGAQSEEPCSMRSKQVVQWLKDRDIVLSKTITHLASTTSSEAARLSHVSGYEVIKAVLVHLTDASGVERMAMAVARSTDKVDCERLAKVAGARRARKSETAEFKDLLPETSEIDAIPPFGPLFDLKVYMDEGVARDRLLDILVDLRRAVATGAANMAVGCDLRSCTVDSLVQNIQHTGIDKHHQPIMNWRNVYFSLTGSELVRMSFDDYFRAVHPIVGRFACPMDIELRDITRLLDKENVRFVHLKHAPAMTAQEVAASTHISGYDFSKTVMVKVDGRLCMAVVSAAEKVNLVALKAMTQASTVEVATPEEFAHRFPHNEIGAMPPFGNIHDMPVYVDQAVADHAHIVFNAGSFKDVFIVLWEDYKRVVEPAIGSFASPADPGDVTWSSRGFKRYLDRQNVKYTSIKHSRAYTSHEIAHQAHVSGKGLAKTVLVKMEHAEPEVGGGSAGFAMVVVRGCDRVDVDRLKHAVCARDVEIAQEVEFKDRFPDCETGAMPPFGHLYGMPVYMDERVGADGQMICFNAGNHKELLEVSLGDYTRVAGPVVGDFAVPHAQGIPAAVEDRNIPLA